MILTEQIDTCSKKSRGRPRGMARRSLDLIDAMRRICEIAQPITGRGVGYKLFTAGLIKSMSRSEMQRVYRLLKEAREQDIIPWDWIVDESRALERRASWSDPESFSQSVIRQYRRDYWDQQSVRVEVWSEKGTIRGVLRPVLDEYGVGFRVMHGFGSATEVYNIAQDDDGRDLIALYVGDWDPSGLYMSERDLPDRLERYDGGHVGPGKDRARPSQLTGLPSFPAVRQEERPALRLVRSQPRPTMLGADALDPNDLRACVEAAILGEIEPEAWQRCKVVERAEKESLRTVMAKWRAPA